jgi:hypothetical protein
MRRSRLAFRLVPIVAVLSLLLPAIASAASLAGTVAADPADPAAAPAGPSVADLGLEPTATPTSADAWEPNPIAPSSSATPKADPTDRLFSAYGGGHRVCRPGCTEDGKCCDDQPWCPCNMF